LGSQLAAQRSEAFLQVPLVQRSDRGLSDRDADSAATLDPHLSARGPKLIATVACGPQASSRGRYRRGPGALLGARVGPLRRCLAGSDHVTGFSGTHAPERPD
jgi:hypothetical protein